MYTRDGITLIGRIADLQINHVLSSLGAAEEVEKGYICPHNLIFDSFNRKAAHDMMSYVSSLHVPELKGRVPEQYQVSRVSIFSDELFSNMTYCDKISQMVMVVLDGSLVYEYEGRPDVRYNLMPHDVFLVNNRTPRRLLAFHGSPTVLTTLWVDYDLMYHLTESEKQTYRELTSGERYAKI